jgi:hypothetical protein
VLGFWEILVAAGYFLTGLNISMGFTKPMSGSSSFGSFMTQTFGHLILSLWLVKGAPNIARFIYPDLPPQKTILHKRLRILTHQPSNQSLEPTADAEEGDNLPWKST